MHAFPRRLLRRPEVRALTGKCDTLLETEIRNGLFVPPVKLSADPKRRSVGWPSDEVQTIVDVTVAGIDEQAMRDLVHQLVAARSAARTAA
jgi:predicted DNA-binding transcriptional regulator AlpA